MPYNLTNQYFLDTIKTTYITRFIVTFKYILFDLDGTLTDSEEGITKSIKYALKSFGIEEEDREKLLKFIGPSLFYSFKTYYGFSDEDAKAATLKYRERFEVVGLYENKLYDGVEDMLMELANTDKKLALATSKPLPYAKKILEYFDIAKYFDAICGAEFEGSSLEKEDIIELALKKFCFYGDRQSDVVMVGDRKYDILGAKSTGISSIGVGYGFAEEGELIAAGADYVIDTVSELKDFLIKN